MTRRSTRSGIARWLILGIAFVFILGACRALPPGLLGVEPVTQTSPVCESGADLLAALQDLRDTDLSEVGVLGLLVTVDIAIEEARTFANDVSEEFGPAVNDIIASLEGLRTTLEGLGDQPTLGASIAAVGEAITEIGVAMDTLSVQLREPCPSEAPA